MKFFESFFVGFPEDACRGVLAVGCPDRRKDFNIKGAPN
jgi:hypothetical protein